MPNDYTEEQQTQLTVIANRAVEGISEDLRLDGFSEWALADVLHSCLAAVLAAYTVQLCGREEYLDPLGEDLLVAVREFTQVFTATWVHERGGLPDFKTKGR